MPVTLHLPIGFAKSWNPASCSPVSYMCGPYAIILLAQVTGCSASCLALRPALYVACARCGRRPLRADRAPRLFGAHAWLLSRNLAGRL